MIDDMVSDVRGFDNEKEEKKKKSDRRRFPPSEELRWKEKSIERVE